MKHTSHNSDENAAQTTQSETEGSPLPAQETSATQPTKALPTVADLTGSDPQFTAELSTDEYMRTIRGRRLSDIYPPVDLPLSFTAHIGNPTCASQIIASPEQGAAAISLLQAIAVILLIVFSLTPLTAMFRAHGDIPPMLTYGDEEGLVPWHREMIELPEPPALPKVRRLHRAEPPCTADKPCDKPCLVDADGVLVPPGYAFPNGPMLWNKPNAFRREKNTESSEKDMQPLAADKTNQS